jgi:RNA polymerase sigma-70 factor, ECF subfamily
MRCNMVDAIGKHHASDPGSEQVLVDAAKGGDELAFETLVKRYQPRIFAIALRYTRVREDAEDIVQQTFGKAFVSLRKFQGRSSFATWISRIAINEALMFLRKGRALREVPIENSSTDEGILSTLEIIDSRPGPEACYLQREEAEILSDALSQLAPAMRGALELCGLAGLTARQAAQNLGLSMAAVKARLFQGRKRTRRMLNRYMKPHRPTDPNAAGRVSQDHLCNAWG